MNVLNINLGFVGPQSMIFITVVGRIIPELMKGLDDGIKEFKKATKEDEYKKVEEK